MGTVGEIKYRSEKNGDEVAQDNAMLAAFMIVMLKKYGPIITLEMEEYEEAFKAYTSGAWGWAHRIMKDKTTVQFRAFDQHAKVGDEVPEIN